MKAQGSLETLFVLGLILLLSLMVTSKFFQQQDSIIVKSMARQAIIGELEKLDKKYYLAGLNTANCTNETRVNFFVTPDPDATTAATLKANAGTSIALVSGGKAVATCFNKPAFVDCTTPCN